MNMLDTLKARLAERQELVKEKTVKVQAMYADLQALTKTYTALHAEFQALQAEITGYQKVVETESRLIAAAQPQSLEVPAGVVELVAVESASDNHESPAEPNKTEIIREALHGHPTGMTPGELWLAVKDQIPRRNYVYAVLARLKDRDQVYVKRGKYVFRGTPKPQEVSIQLN
jgi:hypothetical protein